MIGQAQKFRAGALIGTSNPEETRGGTTGPPLLAGDSALPILDNSLARLFPARDLPGAGRILGTGGF